MAFPDDVLVEGERVVAAPASALAGAGRAGAGVPVVVGAAGYVAALARNQGWQEWGWPAVGRLGGGAGRWLSVLPLVRWRTTHLVVTTRRLLVREGVHGWQGIQVPLDGITAVRTRRTGRFAGARSLLVETEAGEELEFVDVADAERVREALERATTPG